MSSELSMIAKTGVVREVLIVIAAVFAAVLLAGRLMPNTAQQPHAGLIGSGIYVPAGAFPASGQGHPGQGHPGVGHPGQGHPGQGHPGGFRPGGYRP